MINCSWHTNFHVMLCLFVVAVVPDCFLPTGQAIQSQYLSRLWQTKTKKSDFNYKIIHMAKFIWRIVLNPRSFEVKHNNVELKILWQSDQLQNTRPLHLHVTVCFKEWFYSLVYKTLINEHVSCQVWSVNFPFAKFQWENISLSRYLNSILSLYLWFGS